MRTSPRFQGRVALALVAALLAWGAVELGCWFWPRRGWLENSWYTIETQAAQCRSSILPFARPPHFLWHGLSRGDLAQLSGDRDPDARMVTFRTDHEGFRNAHDLRSADLIFLGDSYTEAGNVPEEETFVRRVGELLGQRVRNLGRAAYAPPHERVVLEVHGLPCQPRAVVWQIAEVNDLIESDHFRRWEEAGRPSWPDVDTSLPPRRAYWQRRSPLCRLYRSVRGPRRWPLSGRFREVGGRVHEVRFDPWLPGPPQLPLGNPGMAPLANSLRDGAARLREAGIPLVVVLIPMKIRAMGYAVTFDQPLPRMDMGSGGWDLREEETLARRLEILCHEQGVPFLDMLPAFREAASAGQLVYYPMDTHLTPAGHALVADRMAAALGPLLTPSP